MNYTQSSDFHELVLYQISSERSARKFSSQMSVPNAWTRCNSPVITDMVAPSQMEQLFNCGSWNKILSNIYLFWYWNCILGPIAVETRSSKQCKSLIWILIFVLFWYIRWRKAKTATKTVPPDDHLQEACPFGWSFTRGWPLQMIICKRPAPPDDHLQEAGPFGWSFDPFRRLEKRKRRQISEISFKWKCVILKPNSKKCQPDFRMEKRKAFHV